MENLNELWVLRPRDYGTQVEILIFPKQLEMQPTVTWKLEALFTNKYVWIDAAVSNSRMTTSLFQVNALFVSTAMGIAANSRLKNPCIYLQNGSESLRSGSFRRFIRRRLKGSEGAMRDCTTAKKTAGKEQIRWHL